jgi:hypothetical protein
MSSPFPLDLIEALTALWLETSSSCSSHYNRRNIIMRGCGSTSIGLTSLWPDHVVCYIPAHRILPRQPSLAQPFDSTACTRSFGSSIRRGVSYFLSRKVAIVGGNFSTSSRVLDYAALQQENDSLRYTTINGKRKRAIPRNLVQDHN